MSFVMPKSGTGAPLGGEQASPRALGSWPALPLLGQRVLTPADIQMLGRSLLPPELQGLKWHTGMVGR